MLHFCFRTVWKYTFLWLFIHTRKRVRNARQNIVRLPRCLLQYIHILFTARRIVDKTYKFISLIWICTMLNFKVSNLVWENENWIHTLETKYPSPLGKMLKFFLIDEFLYFQGSCAFCFPNISYSKSRVTRKRKKRREYYRIKRRKCWHQHMYLP